MNNNLKIQNMRNCTLLDIISNPCFSALYRYKAEAEYFKRHPNSCHCKLAIKTCMGSVK